jgi:hemolysin D
MKQGVALWIAALGDMATQHLSLWRGAWSVRHQLEGLSCRADEAEFLASAIALEKTPVSPAPRVAIWLLIGFSAAVVLWAVFGKLDIVATASGKIVASGRSKTIQAIETASVKTIAVHEGDSVKAGQLLLELDATASAADAARLSAELASAQLKSLRAKALLTSLETGRMPVLPTLSPAMNMPPALLAEAQRQAQGVYAEYQARLERIDADTERRRAELHSTEELARKLEQTLPLVSRRAQDYKDLSERSYVSHHAWMEKEQQRLEQEGELKTQHSRVGEIRAALREAQAQRSSLVAEMRRQLLDQLTEGEQQTQAATQELIKAQARQQLMQVHAPIDGTVQQLAVNTIGGVVTPAQALMLLVPDQYPIEVEARLENKDIGFVRPGQAVEVKIETFPYTRYGTIRGKVAHVSHDAVTDDKQTLSYLARIQLEQSSIHVDEKMIALSPGMAVAVEIKTGWRRVMDYFLSPLVEYGSESLRER